MKIVLRKSLTFSFMASRRAKMSCRAIFAAAIATLLSLSVPAGAQDELSLGEAIRLALEHSYSIKGSAHDSASAFYDLRASRSVRYPTLSLNATSNYTDDVPSIDLPFTSIDLGSRENYQADLRVSVPLYTGGKITNQIRMQSELAQAAGYIVKARRMAIAYQARKTYFSAVAAFAGYAAAGSSRERVAIITKNVASLYANGLADSLDLLDARLAFYQAEIANLERGTAYQNALEALATLIDLAKDEIRFPSSLPQPATESLSAIELRDEAPPELIRPEIKALEHRERAANYAIGLNSANYLPNISGYGTYSYGKPNRDIFDKTWNDFWTVGANLTWDFNLGGRIALTRSSARESARSAKMAVGELMESIELHARSAYSDLFLAFEISKISAIEFDIARQKYRLGQEKQRAGRLSLNRLLELEAELSTAEQLYQASLANYYIAETEYLYSIGSEKIYGGF